MPLAVVVGSAAVAPASAEPAPTGEQPDGSEPSAAKRVPPATELALSPASTDVVVSLDPASLELETDEVIDALNAHLLELGLTAAAATDAAAVRAHVSLDRTSAGDLRVRVRVPGADAPFERVLPDERDDDSLLEALGVVVRGALASSAPEPPEPSAPEHADSDSPEGTTRTDPDAVAPLQSQLDLSAAYRGETFAAEQIWHHGVAVRLAWGGPGGLVLEGAVAWLPPHRLSAGVAVQRVPLELAAGWRFRPRRRVRPAVIGVLTAEALGWSGSTPGAAARPGWAARVGVGAAVDLQIDLGAGLFAFGRLTGRGWPLGAQLVLARAAGPATIVAAWPGSGEVAVGVGYHLFFIRNRRRAATSQGSD